MKYFFLLIGLIFNSIMHAQMICEWVNTQYNPSEASEVSFVDYMVYNGTVKSVYETQKIIGTTKEVSHASVLIELQRNGYLSRVHRVLADSSESINEFTYTGTGGTYVMNWTSIFNFGVRKDTIVRESIKGDERNWQIRADSLAYNSAGKICYFRSNRDEVYTTYDKFGRKIKDSIPSNPTLMAHEITYSYRRGKVIKLEKYLNQKIEIKTTYKLDNYGNWIKCTIKSNRNIKNAIIRRKIVYYQ